MRADDPTHWDVLSTRPAASTGRTMAAVIPDETTSVEERYRAELDAV